MDAGELAKQSFLLAPSLTRILRSLEEKLLIVRRVDTDDHRRAVVKLSQRGKTLFEKVAIESEKIYIRIERDFGADNLDSLYAALQDFYTTLGIGQR